MAKEVVASQKKWKSFSAIGMKVNFKPGYVECANIN